MSALAMFGTKAPSLLAFDGSKLEETVQHNLQTLYEWTKDVTREVKITVEKNKYAFRYINNVPLNDTKNTPHVNFFECEWIEIKGNQVKVGRCDQVQEATCGLFKKAMEHRKTRRAFWEKMRALFHNYFIESWEDLFMAMGPGFKGAKLIIDSG